METGLELMPSIYMMRIIIFGGLVVLVDAMSTAMGWATIYFMSC